MICLAAAGFYQDLQDEVVFGGFGYIKSNQKTSLWECFLGFVWLLGSRQKFGTNLKEMVCRSPYATLYHVVLLHVISFLSNVADLLSGSKSSVLSEEGRKH